MRNSKILFEIMMTAEEECVIEGKFFNLFVRKFETVVNEAKKYRIKVLYGYKWNNGGGTYVEFLLKKFYDFSFDYIVDDTELSYGRTIYRWNLFDYLPLDDTIVLHADNTYQDLGGILNQRGYDVKVVNICRMFKLENIGFFEWMECTYKVDLLDRHTTTSVDSYGKDNVTYSVSRGMLIPIVSEYVIKKYFANKTMRMLDIGCGKGGAIICFSNSGAKLIDGIELLPDLCECANKNFQKLGIKSKIYQCDVLAFDDYGKYDVYYIYDAFRGETFSKVIAKIEESLIINPRHTVLIYANPWEHRRVIGNNVLRLKEQIEGDWFTRMVNIYEN